MKNALQTVQELKVIPNAEITVFCREDKAKLFEDRASTITYSKNSLKNSLLALWKLFSRRPDVLVAVFSGSKMYLKHRILFWLIPARNRLAFNKHLDCFYVKHTGLHLLFFGPSGPPGSLLRVGLRGMLFVPRFLYLLGWWIGVRSRRQLKSLWL
jgi:hypothetical protein